MLAAGWSRLCRRCPGGRSACGILRNGKNGSDEACAHLPALVVFVWLVGVGSFMKWFREPAPRVSGALLAIVISVLVCIFTLLFRDYQTSDFFSAGLPVFSPVSSSQSDCVISVATAAARLRGKSCIRGPVVGTLAGLAGLGMLELHCQNFQAAHVLVGTSLLFR